MGGRRVCHRSSDSHTAVAIIIIVVISQLGCHPPVLVSMSSPGSRSAIGGRQQHQQQRGVVGPLLYTYV